MNSSWEESSKEASDSRCYWRTALNNWYKFSKWVGWGVVGGSILDLRKHGQKIRKLLFLTGFNQNFLFHFQTWNRCIRRAYWLDFIKVVLFVPCSRHATCLSNISLPFLLSKITLANLEATMCPAKRLWFPVYLTAGGDTQNLLGGLLGKSLRDG